MLAFFAGPLGKWVVIGVLVAAFGAFSWFKGNEHGTQKLIEYQAAQAKEAVRIVTKQGQVTEKVITKYVQIAGKTKIVKGTVEKEKVRYETLKLDRNLLSVAAVSLHNSAASNTVPDTAKSVDGTRSEVTTATLLETCTANYATYHEVSDRLTGLQEWVREQGQVK